jgi:serine/threonine-protein kinase
VSDRLIGTQIGDFRLDARLGHGGMGVVYRATDLALERTVAIKVLAPHLLDDATARARFQREIQSAVAIEHPHVVPVYAAGYDNGAFFLAMRCVDGPDLGEVLAEEGPLPESRAMRIVGQVASALYAVHEQGIVHRDVKPQNVLLWSAGAPDEHPFLTDFGIAKAIDETRGVTRFGVLGTPGYMAPELREGGSPTPSCDQFSLACVAFELLSGRLPFEQAADGEWDDVPIPLSALTTVSSPVRDTIERALAATPGDRYPNVRAFVMADEQAHESFERSRAIAEVVAERSSESVVRELHTEHGLTDEAIAEIADLKKSEVLRLKRQAARRAIVGDPHAPK